MDVNLKNLQTPLALLNADFKIISGIYNTRLKGLADHTLSKAQLAVGSDRRIHHGLNTVRDAIFIRQGDKPNQA